MTVTTSQKWRALLGQRCPRCCEGKVYATSSKMNERCPVCSLLFDREPGYFLGAMYVSYGMASIFLMVGMLLVHLAFPDVDLGWVVLVCGGLFVPFVPLVTRYARVIWIFWDRWAWPSRPGESD